MRTALLAVVLSRARPRPSSTRSEKADEALNRRDTSSLGDDKIIAGLKQALQKRRLSTVEEPRFSAA